MTNSFTTILWGLTCILLQNLLNILVNMSHNQHEKGKRLLPHVDSFHARAISAAGNSELPMTIFPACQQLIILQDWQQAEVPILILWYHKLLQIAIWLSKCRKFRWKLVAILFHAVPDQFWASGFEMLFGWRHKARCPEDRGSSADPLTHPLALFRSGMTSGWLRQGGTSTSEMASIWPDPWQRPTIRIPFCMITWVGTQFPLVALDPKLSSAWGGWPQT